ncbi:Similar to spop-b: Speckle-type POZ protein B (Xenopus laevis) [Cotesia congregata]|uniref:Similar to spop-b: Speckle-type POZ protein B (Xenopus laevis) n=1 Tax=Cotesia congregata TaxID=51543 RepID=A0A8J2E9Y3_COTCN|nr:Similar to spop-b: Speckle-type POZ protein B (Xenopus laevis) [Cotesia congregata]
MKRGYTSVNSSCTKYEWRISNLDLHLRASNTGLNSYLSSPPFSAVDADRVHTMMKKDHLLFDSVERTVLELSKKKLLENESKNIPNNSLTVGLELTIYESCNNSTEDFFVPSKRPMSEDYKTLYSSKIGSDVLINVDGQKFSAHKTILIARSVIFTSKFLMETDKEIKELELQDITPNNFEKLLEFIYTDEVRDLDIHAYDLLEAANKYLIQTLKDLCEESISRTLSETNVFKALRLADRLNSKSLLKCVMDFIYLNINDLIETQDYLKLENENPDLAFRLLKNSLILVGKDK